LLNFRLLPILDLLLGWCILPCFYTLTTGPVFGEYYRYQKVFQTDKENFAVEKTFREYCLSLVRNGTATIEQGQQGLLI
jgi:hypothetical protein